MSHCVRRDRQCGCGYRFPEAVWLLFLWLALLARAAYKATPLRRQLIISSPADKGDDRRIETRNCVLHCPGGCRFVTINK